MQLHSLKNFVLVPTFIVPPTGHEGKNYCFITFPENDSFLEYYNLMKINPSYCRYVFVPTTQKPFTKLSSEYRQKLLDLKLKGIRGKIGEYFELEGKNFYLDLGTYIDKTIEVFNIKDFKSGRGLVFLNKIMEIIKDVPEDTFERVLLYTINIGKPFEKNMLKKRFWGIFRKFLKGEELPFDQLILFFYDKSGGRFMKLYDKNLQKVNAARIKQVLNKLKLADPEEEVTIEDAEEPRKILTPDEKIEKALFGNNIE